jgi:hypothetical protein
MRSSTLKPLHIAAMLLLVILEAVGLAGAQAGGIPWQVGDVVVCYGGGKCNVVRIHPNSPSPVQLLDTLSDGLLGTTGGAALNNTLHLIATEDHGGGQSKVFVYSIASINPFTGAPIAHAPISTPYDASGGGTGSARAVAVNSAGHIFVGNANPASIVELNADGTPTGHVYTFPTSGSCATTTLASIDIGANADAIYVTAKDGIIRKVTLPLSASSLCSPFANFGSGVTLYGIKDIPAGALSGTCGSNPPNPANNPCPTGESILVVATGFTGPPAVNICTNLKDQTPVSCALLLGTALPSVLARYPVTGVTGLQALALDPLVSNCTGSSGTACSTVAPPARQVTNSNIPTVTASFWVGDSGSGTIYRQKFAGGSPTTFPGTCPTGCGIQSLVIYGGEGANQPGLASLVLNGTLNSSDLFTKSANFFQNTITSTLYNNGSGSPPPTNISLYASLVDKTSCFNDPSVGSLPCQPTVPADSTKALVWKIDVPLNGIAGLPTTQTLNSSFASVGSFGIDASTDVFVDEQFDDTTFVGDDPGTRTISVHSLHEVPNIPQTQALCTYSSPLPNGCYRTNRNTLNFIFTCSGLSATQLQGMQPSLSLVKKNPPQSPQFIPLKGTNDKGPYRFDSSSNSWTFQWALNGATPGTYQGTTFDTTGVQSFPVTFFLKKSCP